VRQGVNVDPGAALLRRLEVPALGEERPIVPANPARSEHCDPHAGPFRLGDRLCHSDGDRVRVDSCSYILLTCPLRRVRSRSLYNGASRQASRRYRRCSVSPLALASFVCMSMQKAYPLIWDARSLPRSRKRWLESASGEIGFEPTESPEACESDVREVEPWFHLDRPSRCVIRASCSSTRALIAEQSFGLDHFGDRAWYELFP
jgi:hypothetical protein